jgi:hypothetical protein
MRGARLSTLLKNLAAASADVLHWARDATHQQQDRLRTVLLRFSNQHEVVNCHH